MSQRCHKGVRPTTRRLELLTAAKDFSLPLHFPIYTNDTAHMFVGPLSSVPDSKDYSARCHFGNCNQTSESPKISTGRQQTSDKGKGTLSANCTTQEVQQNQDHPFVLTVSEASCQWQVRRKPNMFDRGDHLWNLSLLHKS